jgi:hypothetical protein
VAALLPKLPKLPKLLKLPKLPKLPKLLQAKLPLPKLLQAKLALNAPHADACAGWQYRQLGRRNSNPSMAACASCHAVISSTC